jgi:hypothetical protein
MRREKEEPRTVTCVECGREVLALGAIRANMPVPLCCACRDLPGWYDDPQLLRAFDPEYDPTTRLSRRRLHS